MAGSAPVADHHKVWERKSWRRTRVVDSPKMICPTGEKVQHSEKLDGKPAFSSVKEKKRKKVPIQYWGKEVTCTTFTIGGQSRGPDRVLPSRE